MSFSEALAGLAVPTYRGFKGLTILFMIYGCGSLFASILISSLTQAHLDDPSEEDKPEVFTEKEKLRNSTLIVGIVCLGISFISGILAIKYRNVPGISAREVEARNKQRAVTRRSDERVQLINQ